MNGRWNPDADHHGGRSRRFREQNESPCHSLQLGNCDAIAASRVEAWEFIVEKRSEDNRETRDGLARYNSRNQRR